AQRRAEPTSTSVAPACLWTQESFPGTSMSKSWCACLTTETRSPLPSRHGMTFDSKVVLPAPLHPESPITLIPKLRKTGNLTGRFRPYDRVYIGVLPLSC